MVSGGCKPRAVAVVHVEEVFLDLVPARLGVFRHVDGAIRPDSRRAWIMAVVEQRLAVDPIHVEGCEGVRCKRAAEPPGTPCRRRARPADPDRRSRALVRGGCHADAVKGPVPASIAERFPSPCQPSDLHQLVGSRAAEPPIDAQCGELLDPIAGSNPELKPATAELIDYGRVLREANRVLEWGEEYPRAQARGAGPHAEGGKHRKHGGKVAIVGHVMLGKPDRVEAERLCPGSLIQVLAIELVVRPVPAGRIPEVVPEAELHGHPPPTALSTSGRPLDAWRGIRRPALRARRRCSRFESSLAVLLRLGN